MKFVGLSIVYEYTVHGRLVQMLWLLFMNSAWTIAACWGKTRAKKEEGENAGN